MKEYILSCCSTADLTKEHFLSRSINYICFHYALDGVEYLDACHIWGCWYKTITMATLEPVSY